jgi:uncharacterized membrane protein
MFRGLVQPTFVVLFCSMLLTAASGRARARTIGGCGVVADVHIPEILPIVFGAIWFYAPRGGGFTAKKIS